MKNLTREQRDIIYDVLKEKQKSLEISFDETESSATAIKIEEIKDVIEAHINQ